MLQNLSSNLFSVSLNLHNNNNNNNNIIQKTNKIIRDTEKCVNCFNCIDVCSASIFQKDPKDLSKLILVNPEVCFSCGHCLSACTYDALKQEEFEPIKKENKIKLKPIKINSEEMKNLIFSRRSIRHYKKTKLSDETKKEIYSVFSASGTASNNMNQDLVIIDNEKLLEELQILTVDNLLNIFKYFNKNPKKLKDKIINKIFQTGFKFMGAIKKDKEGTNQILNGLNGYYNLMNQEKQSNYSKGIVFRNTPTLILVIGKKSSHFYETDASIGLRNIELFGLTKKPQLGTCHIGFITSASKFNNNILKKLGYDSKNYVISGAIAIGETDELKHYKYKIERETQKRNGKLVIKE